MTKTAADVEREVEARNKLKDEMNVYTTQIRMNILVFYKRLNISRIELNRIESKRTRYELWLRERKSEKKVR